jgi:hypothetical protein
MILLYRQGAISQYLAVAYIFTTIFLNDAPAQVSHWSPIAFLKIAPYMRVVIIAASAPEWISQNVVGYTHNFIWKVIRVLAGDEPAIGLFQRPKSVR